MSKSFSPPGIFGALVVSSFVFQGCIGASPDADSGEEPPPSSQPSDEDDGDYLGGSAGDGDDDFSMQDDLAPVLGDKTSEPSLSGQGGAYENETPAPGPCVSLLSLGEVDQAGAVPGERGMDSLVWWLNEKSNVEATHIPDDVQVNSYLLKGFDVVLLQDVSRWTISQDEQEAFQGWIRAGGSVMALAGYTSALTDKFPANELLSFSGLNHSMTPTALNVAAQCGYCLGETHKQGGWNPNHPISQGLDLVGAYRGQAISGEGDVVASEDGLNLGVTREVGDGRVFLFHDDWVAHTSEWTAAPRLDCQSNPSCAEVTMASTYQMARFWYNAVGWLAKQPACLKVEGVELK